MHADYHQSSNNHHKIHLSKYCDGKFSKSKYNSILSISGSPTTIYYLIPINCSPPKSFLTTILPQICQGHTLIYTSYTSLYYI